MSMTLEQAERIRQGLELREGATAGEWFMSRNLHGMLAAGQGTWPETMQAFATLHAAPIVAELATVRAELLGTGVAADMLGDEVSAARELLGMPDDVDLRVADGILTLQAERDALRAEVERLRAAIATGAENAWKWWGACCYCSFGEPGERRHDYDCPANPCPPQTAVPPAEPPLILYSPQRETACQPGEPPPWVEPPGTAEPPGEPPLPQSGRTTTFEESMARTLIENRAVWQEMADSDKVGGTA